MFTASLKSLPKTGILWVNQDNQVCVWGGGGSWSSVSLLPAFTRPHNPELQTASTCPRYICLMLPEWDNAHSTPQSWTHIRAVQSVYTEEPNWTWANVGSEGYAAMNGKLRHSLTWFLLIADYTPYLGWISSPVCSCLRHLSVTVFPTCLPLYSSPVCCCIIYLSVDFLLLLLLVYSCIFYMSLATSLVRLNCIFRLSVSVLFFRSVAVFFACL